VALPRCSRGRCYQVGGVTLADRGIVFTRNGTSPDRSLVVRRAFTGRRLSQVEVLHDPQPDLVASSAGALYYAFGRGWYRWDFGQRRPHRTGFRMNPPAQLIAYERGRWYLATRRGCNFALESIRAGRPRTLVSPATLHRLVHSEAKLCVVLRSLTWTGRQALTAWAIFAPESSEEHSDHGLAGAALASDALR
jgi:hypothetical protein